VRTPHQQIHPHATSKLGRRQGHHRRQRARDRARLSDAKFFYETDLKRSWKTGCQVREMVSRELGTQGDASAHRTAAAEIAPLIGADVEKPNAPRICKADC